MLNPEIKTLLQAIDDHIREVSKMETPNKKRISFIEGCIREKRKRIAEIESKEGVA